MTDARRLLTSDINVTPFLDVLLVLTITFLASVSARKTMDVQLPAPCADICAGGDRAIVLEVLGDGRRHGRLDSAKLESLVPLTTLSTGIEKHHGERRSGDCRGDVRSAISVVSHDDSHADRSVKSVISGRTLKRACTR
jgi:hypothetical protein